MGCCHRVHFFQRLWWPLFSQRSSSNRTYKSEWYCNFWTQDKRWCHFCLILSGCFRALGCHVESLTFGDSQAVKTIPQEGMAERGHGTERPWYHSKRFLGCSRGFSGLYVTVTVRGGRTLLFPVLQIHKGLLSPSSTVGVMNCVRDGHWGRHWRVTEHPELCIFRSKQKMSTLGSVMKGLGLLCLPEWPSYKSPLMGFINVANEFSHSDHLRKERRENTVSQTMWRRPQIPLFPLTNMSHWPSDQGKTSWVLLLE